MHGPEASSAMSLDTQGHLKIEDISRTFPFPQKVPAGPFLVSSVRRAIAALMPITTHECCLCVSLTQIISHRDEGAGKVSFLFVISAGTSMREMAGDARPQRGGGKEELGCSGRGARGLKACPGGTATPRLQLAVAT